MKIYVKASETSDRRYYLFSIMECLGLHYDGYQSTQATSFGELTYKIKAKGNRYFLDIWIGEDIEQAESVWNAIEDCIHDMRIPQAHCLRYDPSTKPYGSTMFMAMVRDIPAV